jgi:hypothetical protein
MRCALLFLLIVAVMVGIPYSVGGQIDPGKVCRIDDGRMVFTLSLKWSEKDKQQIMERFDLDSALISAVYGGKTRIEAGGEIWSVAIVSSGIVELSKPLVAEGTQGPHPSDLFLLIDDWMEFGGRDPVQEVVFGINNLELRNAFVYAGNRAQFYLPGYEKARSVFISGSFNGWSTSGTPMRRAGKGWIVDMELAPGKYSYKYIVDGRWTTDPVNRLRERGGTGSWNSVVYCTNHTFRLKGFEKARTVVVTGSFSDWSPRGISLQKGAGEWTLQVCLREGTYAYKFLVDGKWITDPSNPETRQDARGNSNSFLEIGEPFLFTLQGFTGARKVVFTGSFNNWDENELVMEKTLSGWELPYVTSAGNYEYKFIVDGKWMPDPANPFSTGHGDYKNSFVALKANHVFELAGYAGAKSVLLSGSFNNWNPDGYRMVREGNAWKFPLRLQPGKFTYKFIVDNQWISDPGNPLLEENQYGTGNSVLWMPEGK